MRYIFFILFVCLFAISGLLTGRAEEFKWAWGDEAKAGQQTTEGRGPSSAEAAEGAQMTEDSRLRHAKRVTTASQGGQQGTDGRGGPEESGGGKQGVESASNTFNWSWEAGAKAGRQTTEGRGPSSAEAAEGQADDSRIRHAKRVTTAGQGGQPPSPEAMASHRMTDDRGGLGEGKGGLTLGAANVEQSREKDAYAALLKENLELRRKIVEAEEGERLVRTEKDRLALQIKDLEQRIAESVAMIQNLKKEKASSAKNLDMVLELEKRLSEAEGKKAGLNRELENLIQEAKIRKPAVQPAESLPVMPGPGSDLFREVEKENAALRDKLAEVESERQKALKAQAEMLKKSEEAQKERERSSAKQKELEQRLAEARSSESQQKKLAEKLMKQLPSLEKELSNLKSAGSEKDATLADKEEEIETLKSELLRREQRLIKAERMAAMLEEAREKVGHENNQQMRDMHYNLGAIYAREGKYNEAEIEYLNALRIDPADAGIHYNLGILYDENLDNKQKAAMHYRRYLMLNPGGGDVDKVKEWLLAIEMQ